MDAMSAALAFLAGRPYTGKLAMRYREEFGLKGVVSFHAVMQMLEWAAQRETTMATIDLELNKNHVAYENFEFSYDLFPRVARKWFEDAANASNLSTWEVVNRGVLRRIEDERRKVQAGAPVACYEDVGDMVAHDMHERREREGERD